MHLNSSLEPAPAPCGVPCAREKRRQAWYCACRSGLGYVHLIQFDGVLTGSCGNINAILKAFAIE